MGRLGVYGKEILMSGSELLGVNFGYGFYAEHERGYDGIELAARPDRSDRYGQYGMSLDACRIADPSRFSLEYSQDGMLAVIENSPWLSTVSDYDNGAFADDGDGPLSVVGGTRDFTHQASGDEYDDMWALWSSQDITLLFGPDLFWVAEELMDGIRIGDVSVLTQLVPPFQDRGLSLVFPSRLGEDEMGAKAEEERLWEQAKEEYRAYCEQLVEMDMMFCQTERDLTDPDIVGVIANFQIHDVEAGEDGDAVVTYYLEPLDVFGYAGRGDPMDLDMRCLHDPVPHRMGGEDVIALAEFLDSEPYKILCDEGYDRNMRAVAICRHCGFGR